MKKLTNQGASWLKVALDPFHDHAVSTVAGYPDLHAGVSVVEKIVKTKVINAGAIVGPWDCMILPTASLSEDLMHNSVRANQSWTTGSASGTIGFLTAVCVPTGYAMYPMTSVLSSGHMTTVNANLAVITEKFRIIACGFEVVNSTAVLSQAGVCSVSVGDAEENIPGTIKTSTNTSYGQIRWKPTWPKTSATFTTNPTTLQWPASQGCYVPMRMYNDECPITHVEPMGMVLGNAHACEVVISGATTQQTAAPSPFLMSRALFTGLSTETTLELRLHLWVERFPDLLEGDPSGILPYAKPSCPDDPMARRLYGQIVQKIPPGVPQIMNPSGEFWAKNVLGALRTVLKASTPALEAWMPGAGLFTTVAGDIAGNIADSFGPGTTPAPRRKKKPASSVQVAPGVVIKRGVGIQRASAPSQRRKT